MMDSCLKEDIEYLVSNCPYLKYLNNKTILITGSTGLIGSFLIKTILEYNKLTKSNVRVIALARNEIKFKEIYKDYLSSSNLVLLLGDVNNEISIDEEIDYVIHGAAITESKKMVSNPVETTLTAIVGTKNLLNLSKIKNVKSMVYLSSMEVYGVFKDYQYVTEDMLGYIDLTNVRSGYPESKRICEYLCNAYFKQYGVNVKIARLAQTFGAGTSLDDTRIFAHIAKSVIDNENIVLRTEGKSDANYCYISDTIEAILTILFKGLSGESYNVSNEECHTTIKEMSEMVCENIAQNKIKVNYNIDRNGTTNPYAPDTKIKLSNKKLRELGWLPHNDLTTSYKRLIRSYRERWDYK